jgi:hypothetical protein
VDLRKISVTTEPDGTLIQADTQSHNWTIRLKREPIHSSLPHIGGRAKCLCVYKVIASTRPWEITGECLVTTAAKDEKTLAPLADTAAYSNVGLSGSMPGRQTFVLGIFPELASADKAVRNLAGSHAKDCDVLLVSGTTERLSTAAKARSRIRLYPADTFLKSGIDFPIARKAPEPFRAFWESVCAECAVDLRTTELSAERLFQQVVKRLSDGATLLIVRTENLEQRMAASRAQLDANCEVLLTHELTAPLN